MAIYNIYRLTIIISLLQYATAQGVGTITTYMGTSCNTSVNNTVQSVEFSNCQHLGYTVTTYKVTSEVCAITVYSDPYCSDDAAIAAVNTCHTDASIQSWTVDCPETTLPSPSPSSSSSVASSSVVPISTTSPTVAAAPASVASANHISTTTVIIVVCSLIGALSAIGSIIAGFHALNKHVQGRRQAEEMEVGTLLVGNPISAGGTGELDDMGEYETMPVTGLARSGVSTP